VHKGRRCRRYRSGEGHRLRTSSLRAVGGRWTCTLRAEGSAGPPPEHHRACLQEVYRRRASPCSLLQAVVALARRVQESWMEENRKGSHGRILHGEVGWGAGVPAAVQGMTGVGFCERIVSRVGG
jgi:hypothetical protein